MRRVLVFGAGKIGSLIACLLGLCEDYAVHLADADGSSLERLAKDVPDVGFSTAVLDARDRAATDRYLAAHRFDAVVSCLPFSCNPPLAEAARALSLHYFDLTEDIGVTDKIRGIAEGAAQAFVSQCGLAPGFVSIAAHDLIGRFESAETVKMRVGALPVNPSNALKYSLTWSTDGLINEYGNPCYGVEQGAQITLQPLEGYETIEVDGLLYEAFNTSGGLGTLAETYAGSVRTMNYKTLRYPGHCEKIQFLMNDLRLNEDRDTLKRILERAIPKTIQDVVLLYVAVSGYRQGELYEEAYVKKIYPQTIAGRVWSAIQVTTASSLACVLDLVLAEPSAYRGFVKQESFPLERFLKNRFATWYR